MESVHQSTAACQTGNFPTLTAALLDSAAALETHINDLVQHYEQRERDLVQCLEQRDHDLRRERLRLNAAYRWLLLIRHSHCRDSHRATSRVVRDAVRELTTNEIPQSPLLYWNRVLRIAS
jgi:hypothetical protein